MTDVYGFKSQNIKKISRKLEKILGISFVLHDSLFHGGDYYLYRSGDFEEVELILQDNRELEDDLAEPDFPEYKVIFYVHFRDTTRLLDTRNQILKAMKRNISLLRSG